MNRGKYNDFDNDFINKMSNLLDQIENTDTFGQPACLITITKSKECFSTGFSLDYWQQAYVNAATSCENF